MRIPEQDPWKLSVPPGVERALLPALQAWRSANEDALLAYAAWVQAPTAARGEAYVTYVAAADREDAALAAMHRAQGAASA